MSYRTIKGNVLESKEKHVAFAISEEGGLRNAGGFSGELIGRGLWPELIHVANRKPGEVVSHTASNGVTYHALVIHSFKPNGWLNAVPYLRKALASLPVNPKDAVAFVQIGTGSAGQAGGANPTMIMAEFALTRLNLVVYVYP